MPGMKTPLHSGNSLSRRDLHFLFVLVLIVGTFLVYFQVRNFGYVWDDNLYITESVGSQYGIRRGSLEWAFSNISDGNYIPLVWLSHACCVTFFGMNPSGHHLVNLVIHLANSVILFFFLKELTQKIVPTFLVAMLFALHPMHVESVAWISGRKDLLSTWFWLLGLWAYVRFHYQRTWGQYLLVTLLFLCGVLSKSMLVTFPITLLIIDGCLLEDFRAHGFGNWFRMVLSPRNLLEKVPWFLISLASGLVTIWAQHGVGATEANPVPLWARVGNAVQSMGIYVYKCLIPIGLSPYYPHPGVSLSPFRVFIAGLGLGIITWLFLIQLKRRPYLLAGWVWFIVTIFPVIGLIQVGGQAYADRYTYVPFLGLFALLAWLIEDLRIVLSINTSAWLTALGVVGACLFVATYRQAGYWKDSFSLFGHAIKLDPNNNIAYGNIGYAYEKAGQSEKALGNFIRAVRIAPNNYLHHYNIGIVFEHLGNREEAIAAFTNAAKIYPKALMSSYRAGYLLVQKGAYAEALPYLDRVLGSPPKDISSQPDIQRLVLSITLMSKGLAMKAQGHPIDARGLFRQAVELYPSYGWSHTHLALSLMEAGRYPEALHELEEGCRLDPANPFPFFHRAECLFRMGRLVDARQTLMLIWEKFPNQEVDGRVRSTIKRMGLGALPEAVHD